jgi:hypothetical protein
MESTKYVGMDVHKEAVSTAVMNSARKVVMGSTLETKAATILQFIRGLRGNLLVTFEEGTWAAWLYDLLKPHVTKITVCNPPGIHSAIQQRERFICVTCGPFKPGGSPVRFSYAYIRFEMSGS